MKKNLLKKALAAFCAFTIIAAGLTGCSSDNKVTSPADSAATDTSSSDTTNEETSAADSEAAQPEESGTKIITTSMGDVEVPLKPQRVIATYGMGDVIALGVIPVATYDVTGTAYEKEVAHLPVWQGFESEEIITYDPDLILVVNQEQYDAVSKIAPTVLIPFTELSMEERLTFLGEVLSKQEEAKKALADFKAKIDNAKIEMETLGLTDSTFSIFEYSDNGGVWVYGDKWGRGGDILYSHLGFKAPGIIQEEIIGKDQYRDVSLEAVNDYAGDYIVFSGELGDLSDNPVWNSIPAVKNGKIIPIDFTLFYDIDIYSSNVQLDYIMKTIKELTK